MIETYLSPIVLPSKSANMEIQKKIHRKSKADGLFL